MTLTERYRLKGIAKSIKAEAHNLKLSSAEGNTIAITNSYNRLVRRMSLYKRECLAIGKK